LKPKQHETSADSCPYLHAYFEIRTLKELTWGEVTASDNLRLDEQGSLPTSFFAVFKGCD